MKKQNKHKSIFLEKIEIIDTASKGKSVAKYNERAIFVQGGVPGDICDITIFKRRKKYWEAKIEKIHTYSERRAKPKCEHFENFWDNFDKKTPSFDRIFVAKFIAPKQSSPVL